MEKQMNACAVFHCPLEGSREDVSSCPPSCSTEKQQEVTTSTAPSAAPSNTKPGINFEGHEKNDPCDPLHVNLLQSVLKHSFSGYNT